MTFLFFLSSCALFKGTQNLQSLDKEKLLDAIQLTGEGRGRLSLGQSQYLFSFDSLLKDKKDWILVVAIPLQGEEVMVLPDLTEKDTQNAEMETFEERIDHEFQTLKLDRILTGREFIEEIRTLIRFNFAKALKQKRDCSEHQEGLVCQLDGENFLVTASEKEFNVTKLLGRGRRVVLEGRNLTDSYFLQTNIRLYSNDVSYERKNSSFSLELFWK
ncbi:MAG: hypothetical protein NDI69_12560 [Bacteriovoracaceae bacterium]|nr:hypothetical protein [Bacteriovoracaceae bacterium]